MSSSIGRLSTEDDWGSSDAQPDYRGGITQHLEHAKQSTYREPSNAKVVADTDRTVRGESLGLSLSEH